MPEEPRNASAFRDDLLNWGAENLRSFPWRRTQNAYEILIAELLLKQTNAEKVVPVYNDFLAEYPDLSAVVESAEKELVEILEPLGLYNQRVDALQKIAENLDENVPNSEDELLKLPYVGPYAANAILCFAFGRRRPVVDVNVVRVYSRVFNIPDWGRKSSEMWEFAEIMLPDDNVQLYNLSLLDFGASICTQRSPNCEICFANNYCDYYLEVLG